MKPCASAEAPGEGKMGVVLLGLRWRSRWVTNWSVGETAASSKGVFPARALLRRPGGQGRPRARPPTTFGMVSARFVTGARRYLTSF